MPPHHKQSPGISTTSHKLKFPKTARSKPVRERLARFPQRWDFWERARLGIQNSASPQGSRVILWLVKAGNRDNLAVW